MASLSQSLDDPLLDQNGHDEPGVVASNALTEGFKPVVDSLSDPFFEPPPQAPNSTPTPPRLSPPLHPPEAETTTTTPSQVTPRRTALRRKGQTPPEEARRPTVHFNGVAELSESQQAAEREAELAQPLTLSDEQRIMAQDLDATINRENSESAFGINFENEDGEAPRLAQRNSSWRTWCHEVFFPFTLPNTHDWILSRGWYEDIMNVIMAVHFVLFLALYPSGRSPEDWRKASFPSALRGIDTFCTLIYIGDSLLNAFVFRGQWVRAPLAWLALGLPVANSVFLVALYSSAGTAAWGHIYVAVFRVVRILRPLFDTKRLVSLRLVMNAMRASLSSLGPVCVIFALLFAWFGVAGMVQFKGKLERRCVHSDLLAQRGELWRQFPPDAVVAGLTDVTIPPYMGFDPARLEPAQQLNVSAWPSVAFACGGVFLTYVAPAVNATAANISGAITDAVLSAGCSPYHTCDDRPVLGLAGYLHGYVCPYEFRCVVVGNPHGGIVGFDNALQAPLTVFVLSTFASFFDVMYWSRGASTTLAYAYYVVFLLLGCLLFLNIFLFVITNEFQKRIVDVSESLAPGRRRSQIERRKSTAVTQVTAMRRRSQAENRRHVTFSPEASMEMGSRGGSRHSSPSIPLVAPPPSDGTTSLNTSSVPDGFVAFANSFAESETNEIFPQSPEAEPEEVQHISYQERIRWIVSSSSFENVSTFFIAVSLIMLASYHEGMSDSLAEVNFWAEIGFAILFAVEVLLRFIAAPTAKGYFMDFFNVTDVISAVVPLLEFAVPTLKALRVIRIFKLLRQFPSIYEWLVAVGIAIKGSPLPISLLLLSMAIFAGIGVQLISGKYGTRIGDNLNYATIGRGMVASLQVVSADSWDLVMYDAMLSSGSWVAVPFVIYFIFVNFFLLNILVGIMLTAIPPADDAATVEEPEEDRGRLNHVMTVVIIICAGAMGLENPISAPDTTRARALFYVDLVCTILFVVELVARSAKHGLVRGHKSYLRRSHWNKIDFVLILISVLGLVPFIANASSLNLNFIRVIRILRVLRPLRLGTQILELQLVMRTVVTAARHLWCVGVIVLSFIFVWSVVGVFLFAGDLQQCRVGREWFPELPVANCSARGGVYTNPAVHFDNFFAAMESSVQIVSLNGWADVAKALIDSQGPQMPQKFNARLWTAWYPATLAVFGGMVLVNLFGAVLIVSYNALTMNADYQLAVVRDRTVRALTISRKRIRTAFNSVRDPGDVPSPFVADGERQRTSSQMGPHSGSRFVGENDDDDMSLNRLTATGGGTGASTRFTPSSGLETVSCMALAESRGLLYVVNGAVLLSVIFSAANGHNAPSWLETVNSSFNAACSLAFVVELIIKLKGLGASTYFGGGWNRFDCIVTVLSVIGTTFAMILAAGVDSPALKAWIQGTALVQSSRLLRAVHVLRSGAPVRQLLTKIINGIWDLRYVGLMSFLVMYIYAVAAVQLFGKLQEEPFGSRQGNVDFYNNFHDVFSSFTTLVRGISEGTWPMLSLEGAKQEPFCLDRIGNCGHGFPIPSLFFVSLFVIGRFLLLNLSIAVLLQTFFSSTRSLAISRADAEHFLSCWFAFADKQSPDRIEASKLLDFFRMLSPKSPLGRHNRQRRAKRIVTEVRILFDCQFKAPTDLVSRKIVREVVLQQAFLVGTREYEEQMEQDNVITWESSTLEDLVSGQRERQIAVLKVIMKDWIRRRKLQRTFVEKVKSRVRSRTMGNRKRPPLPRMGIRHSLSSYAGVVMNTVKNSRLMRRFSAGTPMTQLNGSQRSSSPGETPSNSPQLQKSEPPDSSRKFSL